jgi:hypothetical protein
VLLSRRRFVPALAGAALGCRSAGTQPAEATNAPATPAVPPASGASGTKLRSDEPAHPLDELFRGYQKKLPEPATLSEGNGATLKCPHHGYVTYTLLFATAEKLPLQSDADVARLVRWYRDGDPCIRYIALEGFLPKITHDRDRLSLPGMHEPGDYQHRDILVSVKLFLDAKRVAYDAKLFDGVIVSVTPKDFGPMLHGNWKEAITKSYNFRHLVAIDAKSVRVTRQKTTPDPQWPDRTSTTEIQNVAVDERQQFVVSGADQTYTFMPVTSGVAWFDNGEPGDWRKLEKVSP